MTPATGKKLFAVFKGLRMIAAKGDHAIDETVLYGHFKAIKLHTLWFSSCIRNKKVSLSLAQVKQHHQACSRQPMTRLAL